jgi:hypothetical protein
MALQAVAPDAAFSPHMSAEYLWRGAETWKSSGHEEQGEWLHDMAVTLLDIDELPTATFRTTGADVHDGIIDGAALRQRLLEYTDVDR